MYVPAASLSLQDRFSLVVGGLVRAVYARMGSPVLTHALLQLIWMRITTLGGTVNRLVLAIRAGTLRTRRSPAPGSTASGGTRRDGTRRRVAPKQAVVLPRGHAWLVKLMGPDAVASGLHLMAVLEDPEMAALLAASPRLVRTLKPLCRMLGVTMPAVPEPVPPPASPSRRRTPRGAVAYEAGTGDAAVRRRAPRAGPGDRRLRKIVLIGPPSFCAYFVTIS